MKIDTLFFCIRLLALSAVAAFALAGCTSDEGSEKGEDKDAADTSGLEPKRPTSTDALESGNPTPYAIESQWIMRQVEIQTLEKMLELGDSQEILTARNDYYLDHLIDSGLVVERADGEYEVVVLDAERESDGWGNWGSNGLGDEKNTEIDQGLLNIMRDNDVHWCGEDVPATEFTLGYRERHVGSYSTFDEYRESIDDYVNCGDGNL